MYQIVQHKLLGAIARKYGQNAGVIMMVERPAQFVVIRPDTVGNIIPLRLDRPSPRGQ